MLDTSFQGEDKLKLRMKLRSIVRALNGLPLSLRIKDRSFATDSIILELENLPATFLSACGHHFSLPVIELKAVINVNTVKTLSRYKNI